MSVIIDQIGPKALELGIAGTLEKKDYKHFTTYAEQIIKAHGEINLLVRLPDKLRFTPAALWEDLKFDVSHHGDVARLALVSADESKEWLATIAKPFTRAEVRFMPADQIDAAREWVSGAAS
jgi:hypothetical protein